MVIKTGYACGTCPRCGRKICRPRLADYAVCDCWMYCPLCGRKMEPYTPDLTPQLYVKGDIDLVRICCYHKPPYKNKQKPVEVILE